MRPKITGSQPAIAEADLQALEAELGNSLPEDYREFLLANNGGFPDRAEYSFLRDGEAGEASLQLFFAVGGEDDIKETWSQSQGALPRHILPIGSNHGCGMLCISLAEERGKLYFWDLSVCPNLEEGELYCLFPLTAGSFSQFLEECVPPASS